MKTQRFFAFVFVVMLLVSALNTVLAQGPVPEDALLWVDLNNSGSAGSDLATKHQGRLTTDSGIDPVNEVCPQRITLEIDGNSMQVPYCRNFPLGQSNAAAQRAIVVLYGASRTAQSYFDTMLEAAVQANGVDSATIILAPQFLLEEDLTHFDLGDDLLFWSYGGWKRGDKSKSTDSHPRPVRISSFSVVDMVLERLSDKRMFPNLTQIVIAGHSAGGQFVNRFAAGSEMEPSLLERGIQVRYLVANPSSYLYFDGQRRVAGALDQFAIPDLTSCPSYNEYKYGLDDLNSYMAFTGRDQIRAQYPRRNLLYILGAKDIDTDSPVFDSDCAAMLQGENRLERGRVYFNYLQHYFGGQRQAIHDLAFVPDAGHSAREIFHSDSAKAFLFDYAAEESASFLEAASTLEPVATDLAHDTPSDSPSISQPTLESESSAAGESGTGCWGGVGAMVVPTLLIAALGQSRARFCSPVRKENNVRS